MGNNNINGGVNNDSLAKLKAIIADGQVKAEELKGLSDTEKDALQKYLQGEGKDLPKDGEIVYLKEPVAQNDNRSNGSMLWDAFTGALGKVLGGILALTPIGSAGCSNETPTVVNQGDVTQTVTVNVQDDYTDLLKAIQKLNEDTNTKFEDVITEIKGILARQDMQTQSLEAILKELTILNVKMETLVEVFEAVGKTTTEILDALKAGGNQLSEIAIQLKGNTDILKEISGKSTKIYEALNELLTQNETFNAEQKNTLNNILNKIDVLTKKGDFSKIEDLLASILSKIGDLDKNSATRLDKVIASINENTDVSKKTLDIANKILEAMANDKAETAVDYTDMLNQILEKLGTINGDQAQGADLTKVESLLDAILGKINTAIENQNNMSNENKDFYNKLLAKLDGMSGDEAKAFEDLLAAIKENTTVAKGTFEVATLIFEEMGKLGDKADAAINVLKNLSTGGDCNFNQADMQAFIKAIANSLIDTYTSGNKTIYDKLDEILNKIPDSCTCNGTMIIERLNTIIDNMKTAPDDKTHEGIIGDLGELFG